MAERIREMRLPNAVVRLHGEINMDKLKEACAQYAAAMDKAQREKKENAG